MTKHLRIGITTDAIDDGGAGIGVYIRNLIENISKLDKANEYFLIHNRKNSDKIYKLGLKEIIIPSPKIPFGREIRKVFLMPIKLRKYKLDIVHETSQIGPFFLPSNYKRVVTVHDLIALIYPETSPKAVVFHTKYAMPIGLRAADKIIVNSENTKKDLIKYFKVPTKKIKRIYYGLDTKFKVVKDKKKLEQVRKKYKLPKRFFVMVSTIEPRKNMPKMIEAFSDFKKKNPEDDIKLIIIGGKGWRNEYEKVTNTIRDNNMGKSVILQGCVDNWEMPDIYNLAEALIFPTLYEGFGLPIMEAMSSGCKVVTSTISSMPEVANGCAVLVNSNSRKDIAKGMNEIVKKPSDKLIKKGLENVKRFSWPGNVNDTLEVYREVMRGV